MHLTCNEDVVGSSPTRGSKIEIISGNPEKFMKICEVLNISEASTADGLRKKIKQFNIDQAKAAKNKADKAKSSEDSKKEEKK